MTELLYTTKEFTPYHYPLRQADTVFMGIPFVSTSISKPAVYGPTVVREAFRFSDDFHNGRDVMEKHKFCDVGNIDVAPGSYEITAKRIRQTIREIRGIRKNMFFICIGGEHLVSLPVVEALKPKTIVQIDAHSDLADEYEGVKYGHATWAYHASKNAHLIQIGVKSYSPYEKRVIKKHGIEKFTLDSFPQKIKLKPPVHLTLDVDIFHNAYVETGFPEGYAMPQQVLDIIEQIKCDSLDIVEIADDRLPSKTGFIAAEVVKTVFYNNGEK